MYFYLFTLLPSENEKTSVVCFEQTNTKHSVSVKNDTLVIEVHDSRKWYEHIGINFKTSKITVYIPQGEYGVPAVKTSTGNVRLDGSDAAEIFVKTDTGDVTGSLLTEKMFITHTDTGRINVPKAESGGKCEITTNTGNIKFS